MWESTFELPFNSIRHFSRWHLMYHLRKRHFNASMLLLCTTHTLITVGEVILSCKVLSMQTSGGYSCSLSSSSVNPCSQSYKAECAICPWLHDVTWCNFYACARFPKLILNISAILMTYCLFTSWFLEGSTEFVCVFQQANMILLVDVQLSLLS